MCVPGYLFCFESVGIWQESPDFRLADHNPSKTIGFANSYFYHMACCHGSSPASNKEVQRFNDACVLMQTWPFESAYDKLDEPLDFYGFLMIFEAPHFETAPHGPHVCKPSLCRDPVALFKACSQPLSLRCDLQRGDGTCCLRCSDSPKAQCQGPRPQIAKILVDELFLGSALGH